MAILPAIEHRGGAPAAEAARLLGVSPQRVRALAAAGQLPAYKQAGRWFIERRALEKRLREGQLHGRPFKAAQAWGLIALAEGGKAEWLDAPERSRLRRVLRQRNWEQIVPCLQGRSKRLPLRAHSSDLRRLASESDLVRSGISAASDHRFEIVEPGAFEAYVSSRRLGELQRRYRLKASDDPNVVLRVIEGVWPFPPHSRVAPRLAAALDLLDDDDERTRRAGRLALRSYGRLTPS